MLTKLISNNRKGFTLVELLIVVAIVGILATVGIPGYQRMVQKSRQSEAKVNLGNVALVESTFFSEYGAYGNNLAAMGFEADNELTMRYVVGFTSAACADLTGGAFAGVLPAGGAGLLPPAPAPQCVGGATPFANAICAGNADFYTGVGIPIRGVFGNGPAGAPGTGRTTGPTPGTCQVAAGPFLPAPAGGGAPAVLASYLAGATGTIAPGFLLDGSSAGDPPDMWTMDQTKLLRNTLSGVQ